RRATCGRGGPLPEGRAVAWDPCRFHSCATRIERGISVVAALVAAPCRSRVCLCPWRRARRTRPTAAPAGTSPATTPDDDGEHALSFDGAIGRKPRNLLPSLRESVFICVLPRLQFFCVERGESWPVPSCKW